ncbi:MAG: hypothetical protein JSR77_08085 [Planctomycetes bacterium]|nr:hypothetical protein [Planctomycetota bacterium]
MPEPPQEPVAGLMSLGATELSPKCARCGYDQSGVIPTWTDACPIRGTCSECGFTFEWGDILNGDRGKLPGLVEHSRGVGQMLRWTFTTAMWLVLPNRFWDRVHVHHAPRLSRILVSISVVLLAAHLMIAAACIMLVLTRGAPVGTVPWRFNNVSYRYPELLSPLIEPVAQISVDTWRGSRFVSVWPLYPVWAVPATALLACILAWPLMFLALPVTRHRSRLRWEHVWRAGLYPTWVLGLMFVLNRIAFLIRYAGECVDSILGGNGSANLASAANGLFYSLRPIAWVVVAGWIAAWWYFAIVRGWRLENGRTLWSVLLVAVAAASALVGTFAWMLLVRMSPFIL